MSLLKELYRRKSIEEAVASAESGDHHGNVMAKNLRVVDLTALGIATVRLVAGP